jgi:hypothetical protein
VLPKSGQQIAATAEDLRSRPIPKIGTHCVLNGFQPCRPGCEVRQVDGFDQRKYIMPIVAVLALGTATPAMAYDAGDVISMQEALGVATDIGLISVSHTQFAGDKWEIEGRDRAGRYMEVAVDAATGDVLWVNR